ncbi:hypothetical protein [Actinokineospora sp.]|uniref:hypothetical protein n=1 Tax=Actinokineospora sp. TaxID=1872133 RepID=UPI003D6AEC7C
MAPLLGWVEVTIALTLNVVGVNESRTVLSMKPFHPAGVLAETTTAVGTTPSACDTVHTPRLSRTQDTASAVIRGVGAGPTGLVAPADTATTASAAAATNPAAVN